MPNEFDAGETFALDLFERRLVGRSAKQITASKRAAVATLLRWGDPAGPEVLLMRRAEAAGDQWSGQVCLPGGKAEPGDADLHATALRETREEVGIELSQCSRYLGPLDALPAMARGRILSTSISPFVFQQTSRVEIRLGAEAAHAFWLPLARAAGGEFDSHYDYDTGKGNLKLPCWRYEGEVIWGLTFKMLGTLLDLVGPPDGAGS